MQKIIISFLFTLLLNPLFGAVVYNDIADYQIQGGSSFDIDLNQDGTAEFTLEDMGYGGSSEIGTFFNPSDVNFVTWSDTEDWDAFKPVSANASIAASSGFYAQGDCYFNPMWATSAHQFPIGSDQYIGVKFKIGSAVHYAWIRVLLASDGTVTIKDMAYESTANTPIAAGNIGGGSTAISDNKELEVKVFPNPTSDFLNLSGLQSKADQLVIYSADGRMIIQQDLQGAEQVSIPVSTFQPGYYIVEIKSSNSQLMRYTFFKL